MKKILLQNCLLLLSANFALAASISFTYVPPYGTYNDLSGQVTGVANDNYKVLVYIYVYGWWNKPTWAAPLTTINHDGSWVCDITTGGASDTTATEIIAFLVPNDSYQSSWEMHGNADLPAELYVYPYTTVPRIPANRAIRFADHNWAVKSGYHGPGPNNFSDGLDSVWVDASGYLHLKIRYSGGLWYCSEIISDESFGYGTYVFTVDSRLDDLDRNAVLGLFTWDTYAPEYNYREIDFEFSRWKDPDNEIGQYVIQPWYTAGNLLRFEVDYSASIDRTTHVMTWRPDGIYFKSYYGDFSLATAPDNIIIDWHYTGADNPPPGGENARMNFWLIDGLAPSDGAEDEIIITDFQFLTGISNQPGDINDDMSVNLADFAELAFRWLDDNCGIYNRWCNEADLTCSGRVEIDDIGALMVYWLESLN